MKKTILPFIFLFLFKICFSQFTISANHRYLLKDGKPFTSWAIPPGDCFIPGEQGVLLWYSKCENLWKICAELLKVLSFFIFSSIFFHKICDSFTGLIGFFNYIDKQEQLDSLKKFLLEKERAKRNRKLDIRASLKGSKPLSKNQKNEINMPFSKWKWKQILLFN